MIPYTLIDGKKFLDATLAQIRQAVAEGKMVIAVDDANVAMQIDKATLARIDEPAYPAVSKP